MLRARDISIAAFGILMLSSTSSFAQAARMCVPAVANPEMYRNCQIARTAVGEVCRCGINPAAVTRAIPNLRNDDNRGAVASPRGDVTGREFGGTTSTAQGGNSAASMGSVGSMVGSTPAGSMVGSTPNQSASLGNPPAGPVGNPQAPAGTAPANAQAGGTFPGGGATGGTFPGGGATGGTFPGGGTGVTPPASAPTPTATRGNPGNEKAGKDGMEVGRAGEKQAGVFHKDATSAPNEFDSAGSRGRSDMNAGGESKGEGRSHGR